MPVRSFPSLQTNRAGSESGADNSRNAEKRKNYLLIAGISDFGLLEIKESVIWMLDQLPVQIPGPALSTMLQYALPRTCWHKAITRTNWENTENEGMKEGVKEWKSGWTKKGRNEEMTE